MTSPVTPGRTQRWALGAITAYQRAVEGRPSPCRFYPSCSSYAHEAFVVHGTRRGVWLTVRRLLRCRPFGPSGFDPVPEPDPHPLPPEATSAAGTRCCSPTTHEDC